MASRDSTYSHSSCSDGVEIIIGLKNTIIQRLKQQRIGRFVAGSLVQGVEHAACELQGTAPVTFQAAINEAILGDVPYTCYSLVNLAATCRRLRACVEPILYRVTELNYNDTRRYAKHIELLGRFPHLAQHVRALSFNTHADGQDAPQNPMWLQQRVAAIVSEAELLPTKDIITRLDPVSDANAWKSRFVFLFLCPNVHFLKVDLGLPHWMLWQQARVECLFTVFTPDPISARKIPAFRNLREFSIIFRDERHDFDVRNLLPFLLLPSLRIVYINMLQAEDAAKHNFYNMSPYHATSSITELTLDFARLRLPALVSILAMPKALRKFVYSFGEHAFYTKDDRLRQTHSLADNPIVRAIHVSACLQPHRPSLETLTVHGSSDLKLREDPFPDLDTFIVLTHLTIPLRMLLVHPDGSRRSLVSALPPAIVRLELFACDHYFVEELAEELWALLEAKASVPRLQVVRVEHWVLADSKSHREQMEVMRPVVEHGGAVGVVVEVVMRKGIKSPLNASLVAADKSLAGIGGEVG